MFDETRGLKRMAMVVNVGECLITLRLIAQSPTDVRVWATATVSEEDRSPYGLLKDGSDTAGILQMATKSVVYALGPDLVKRHAIDQDSEGKAYGSITLAKPVESSTKMMELMSAFLTAFNTGLVSLFHLPA